MASEEGLGNEQDVEVKRPVVVRRIVTVKTGLHHLVDEPAVDPLVEMRRLDAQEEEPEHGPEGDDPPERPIGPGQPLGKRWGRRRGLNFSSRGFLSAAR